MGVEYCGHHRACWWEWNTAATTEHAGGSGILLCVGAEMEAYGNQAAASSNCKSREEPIRKPDHQHG